MPELHFTTDIDGPPEAVFDLIADLAHYGDWLPGSGAFGTISEISPLPVQLGTTYVDAGPTGTRYGTVTEFLRPVHIGFHQPMRVRRFPTRGMIDIRLRHRLTAVGPATRLDRDLTIGLPGGLRLAQPIVMANLRKENDRVLSVLKAYVEAGPPLRPSE